MPLCRAKSIHGTVFGSTFGTCSASMLTWMSGMARALLVGQALVHESLRSISIGSKRSWRETLATTLDRASAHRAPGVHGATERLAKCDHGGVNPPPKTPPARPGRRTAADESPAA